MRKNVDLLDGTPEMIPGDVYMGVVTKFGNTKKKKGARKMMEFIAGN